MAVRREVVSSISVSQRNELALRLQSLGREAYQYIYREAAGVYWDPSIHSFKSTPMQDWSHSRWFVQIVSVVRSSLAVDLVLSNELTWEDIPDSERQAIVEANRT